MKGEWGRYDEAVEATGFSPETCRKYGYVAENIKVGMRIPTLSFKHHQIVTPLSEKDQNEQ